MHRLTDPVSPLKRQLAEKILELLDGWSNSWAAWEARLPYSRVSEMRRGNLENISLDRMVQCLAQLGHRVDLVITRNRRPYEKPAGEGRPV